MGNIKDELEYRPCVKNMHGIWFMKIGQECPNCGKENEIETWINVSQAIEEIKRLDNE